MYVRLVRFLLLIQGNADKVVRKMMRETKR